MTYKQAAQSALDVQDACNLSGVALSFADAIHAICEEQQRICAGTDWKNHNPIAALYLYKMADLADIYVDMGQHNESYFCDVLDKVRQIVRE